MTAQDLKNSILQLAVQGKLVEQRAEEGTAKELIEQIGIEKERLIKEGKIRKEKPLPKITEEETPFEIPESWEWVRLGDICTKLIDGNHNPPKGVSVSTEYIMASSTNINNDTIVELDKVRYLTKEVFEKENERTKVTEGDIFLTSVGTLGRSCVYEGGYNICFQRSVSVICTLLFNYYLKYLFDSAYFQHKVKREATGTAQKGFYLNQLAVSLIPVPPLAEQKRIVAKVEELLPCIKKYDKAYFKLEKLDKKFSEDIQKSILQYAMQGKLVEQKPEEGTGEELYWRIQAEKEKLIKAGKLKKEKRLPEITRDEIPFDIPNTWAWVRVGDLFTVIRGSSPRPKGSPLYWSDKTTNYNWITIKDISVFCKDGVLNHTTEYLTEAGADLSTYVGEDELIIAVSGSTTGKHCVLGIAGYIYDGLAAILNPTKIISSSYLLLFFDWVYDRLNAQKVGSAFPNINTDILKNTLMPLPPLDEQKRILRRLKSIMPYVQKL